MTVEKLLTEQEAAAMMGRSQHTLRTSRCRKTGLPYRKIGGRIYYRFSDVQEYCQGQLVIHEPVHHED